MRQALRGASDAETLLRCGRSGAGRGGGHERDTDLLAVAGRRGRPRLLGRAEVPHCVGAVASGVPKGAGTPSAVRRGDQGTSGGSGGAGTGEMFLPGCAGGCLCKAAGTGGGGGQRSGAAAGDSTAALPSGPVGLSGRRGGRPAGGYKKRRVQPTGPALYAEGRRAGTGRQ